MNDITLQTLQQVTRGRLRCGINPSLAAESTPIGSIATDSRYVLASDVFWALPGNRHDGAQFSAEAFARGAAGVVTQSPAMSVPADRWILEVDDSLAALSRLAAWRRNQFAGQVVGITGSVAKSTTREMLNAILRQSRLGVASPRSFNNQIGLPLSMLEIDPRMDYALFELGTSGAGEIDRLAELCRPQIGIITAVGDAHYGAFGSYEAVGRAKCELLHRLLPGGLAVLNGDCVRLRRAAAAWNGRKIWFGRNPDSDVMATDVELSAGSLRFCVGSDRFEAPVWGRHQLLPALAAVATARALGVSASEIRDGLAAFEPLAHRSVVRRLGDLTVIDDSYNANPTAMQAALALLREMPAAGRKIAVLGDMLELGDASPAFHRLVGDLVVTQAGADSLIACGQYAAAVTAGAESAGMRPDRVHGCRTVEEVWKTLRKLVQPGDVVLIKASRAIGLERTIAALEAEQRFATAAPTASASPASYPKHDFVNRTFGAPSLASSLRELGAARPPG